MRKMKKLICSILSLLMVVSIVGMMPITSVAANGQYGVLTYSDMTDRVVITDCDTSATGKIVIPDTINEKPVTGIWPNAFENCSEITEIVIPESVYIIFYYAFRNCTSLKEIVIPEAVTTLGHTAFRNCTSLEKVQINADLTYIPDNCFWYCTNLTEINIPDSVTEVGGCAFRSCDSLVNIDLPDSLKTIDFEAFYSCDSLESINIPANVSEIDYYVFEACRKLKEITVDEDNQYFSSENGVLFDKNKTKLIAYPAGKEDSTYIIPDGVTFIEEYAFSRSRLNSLVIPKSVETIGIESVYESESLTAVYYCGTEEEWANVEKLQYSNCEENGKSAHDDIFKDYTMHYNYCPHKNTQLINYSEATCVEDGYTGDVYCSDCETTVTYGEVAVAPGHEYNAVVTAPTCTEDGYTTYTCACGDSYVADYVDAVGHKDADGDNKCDSCEFVFETDEDDKTDTDNDADKDNDTDNENEHKCYCDCHSGNSFISFFQKIIRFLRSLLGLNFCRQCKCSYV